MKYEAHAVIACQREGCDGRVDTKRARAVSNIERGVRFHTVPCDSCEATYTIEALAHEPPLADEPRP